MGGSAARIEVVLQHYGMETPLDGRHMRLQTLPLILLGLCKHPNFGRQKLA